VVGWRERERRRGRKTLGKKYFIVFYNGSFFSPTGENLTLTTTFVFVA
jgi:hypothetical protein